MIVFTNIKDEINFIKQISLPNQTNLCYVSITISVLKPFKDWLLTSVNNNGMIIILVHITDAYLEQDIYNYINPYLLVHVPVCQSTPIGKQPHSVLCTLFGFI